VQGSVVPAEEDCQFDAPFAVLEAIAFEEFIMREHLAANQIGILLQPLFEYLHGVLLPPLVQKSVSHIISANI
jgi:hypothetical protein